jgi:hypothetical protein
MMLALFRMPPLAVTNTAAGVVGPLLSLATPAQTPAGGHGGSGPTVAHPRTPLHYKTTHFAAGDAIKVSTKVTTTGTTVQVTDVTKAITKKLTGPEVN